jgi:diphosphomevalonate decarboxylase
MVYHSSWRSPSNIALVKYWGKYDVQLPRNPSLSFTLSSCHTDMRMEISTETTRKELVVLYDGVPRPAFEPKINAFFDRIIDRLPWLNNASIIIDSVNTFPYGAGIASSASAMSALALCLIDINSQLNAESLPPDELWRKTVSELARTGSGSACRSVFPVASLWGRSDEISSSSNEYAIPLADQLSAVFHTYQDTILLVSSKEKSISSSMGHELMTHHPYSDARYSEAKKNVTQLMDCMQSDNDLDRFISICESEALQLHALMMSGEQPFILMEPDTIRIIKEVWRFRKETGIPVCFTLDAGPNVHLLYPFAYRDPILVWIKSNLVHYCADGLFIMDHVGSGPEKLA